MDKTLSAFGLTDSQTRILFSLESYMSSYDASLEETFAEKMNPLTGKHEMKLKWCNHFQADLTNFLANESSMEGTNAPSLYTSPSQICMAIINENSKSENDIWKYMILLECALFQPYFPISESEVENKQFKGLAMKDSVREEMLEKFASWLSIDYAFVKQVTTTYEKTVKRMNGYWNKVLIGVGAGIVASLLAVVTAGGSIAAMFAASGLYGAAAISSGLAALGGGAIAAGGFGMAGGMAVLVGGGMILGSGAGGAISMAIASSNPTGIMTETAKLYVVLKEIILGLNHDTAKAQEVIESVVDKMSEYKKEIARLKIQISDNREKIKNLEKSIGYFEDFLKMAS